MIDPYSAASAGTQTKAQSSLSKLGSDYQSFLKLLTAQISNQDPLEPMDSTTFVTQLAQLSQVEQTVATNTNLEAMSAQLSSLGSLAGLSLIGKTVVAPSNQLALAEGLPAQIPYRLAGEANAVTMTIRDADGSIVRVLKELPRSADGIQQATWDGRDMDGLQMPEGNYSVEIEALNAEGGPITAGLYAKSRVTGLSFEDGLATLMLANGDSVMAGAVERIE